MAKQIGTKVMTIHGQEVKVKIFAPSKSKYKRLKPEPEVTVKVEQIVDFKALPAVLRRKYGPK